MEIKEEANKIALYVAMLARGAGIKAIIEAVKKQLTKKQFSKNGILEFAEKFRGCKNNPVVAEVAISLGKTVPG